MDVTVWAEQDADGNTTLFVTLKSRIEMGMTGTRVYNMMGFRDAYNNGQWDWLRCGIDFDGAVNANANTRYWTVSDHFSSERPWEIGAENVSDDTQQDWEFIDGLDYSYTNCPNFDKCTFQCSAKRSYLTSDLSEDY